MEIEVIVHHDSDTKAYWAEVVQLPGCYAAGHSRQELLESLEEAVGLYLEDADASAILTSDRVEGVERYQFTENRKLLPA